MIRLGVRLTVKGGREAVTRLIVTAAAVALGVGLLLVTIAVSAPFTPKMFAPPGSHLGAQPAAERQRGDLGPAVGPGRPR